MIRTTNLSMVHSAPAFVLAGFLAVASLPARADAVADGITGIALSPTFDLTADVGFISTFDGNSLLIWGLDGDDPKIVSGDNVQYPAPTLIVTQGDTVTVNLINNLPVATSLVFPGQTGVVASGDQGGVLTKEAAASGGTASYSFTASRAGTFIYHSGTDAELQTEMGLVGALIVRPPAAGQAYGHSDTAYVHEYVSLVTQMDPDIHEKVATGQIATIDQTSYRPVYWFINGRNWPNTVAASYSAIWPTQPYGAKPRTRPGEVVLMRLINGGRATHPWHTHGNHALIIARDGNLLESVPGAGPDLAYGDFTMQVHPGTTFDILFQWTGAELGWDIYGDPASVDFAHTCNGEATLSTPGFDATTNEYCPDHGKLIPVLLPELQTIAIGGFFSGSPYMGQEGFLPPGEGGLNLNGGQHYLWHSHNAFEQVNNDEPPGGMTTILVVEPPGTSIP